MALIAGFPDFAASPAPSASDLNAATKGIIEQIGGVDADGALHDGNLRSDLNFAGGGADALFTNGQKAEARSYFCVVLADGAAQGELGTATRFSLPFDAVCHAICYAGGGGTVLSIGLRVLIDGVPVADFASETLGVADTGRSWPCSFSVPRGAQVSIDFQHSVSAPVGHFLSFWMTAEHVSG